ncbi:MAG: hypothetical protein KGJ90_01845 [Patescibacteria group bacterium]|nr:hypothetical protein [Patescibacteria group bacterium]
MSVLFITEYKAVAVASGAGGPLAVALEPPVATQVVTINLTSTASAVFNVDTHFVRLNTDETCSVKFGASPTATTNDERLAANQTEFFGISRAGLSVAVIANS